MFYLGTGTKFDKKKCKEYKTKDGALKALAKLADGVVWNESGAVVAYEMNGAVTVAAGGQQDGAETATDGENATEAVENTPDEENAANGAQDAQESIIIPQGNMKVTVIYDGSLNLRRSPSWDDDSICGRASRGQSYYVKAVRTVAGKKMVETIDGLFLSGEGNHVQFEQL